MLLAVYNNFTLATAANNMQPTKQDAIDFLNQVITLCEDQKIFNKLKQWAEQDKTDQIAEWYCDKLNLSMEKFIAIQQVIEVAYDTVYIEYYFCNAKEMLDVVLEYDYGDKLKKPVFQY